MSVQIERSVQQVRDGSQYKGEITIGDVKFEYKILFVVPLPQFSGLAPAKDVQEVRQRIQITLRRGDTPIELTDEEYECFFFAMLAEFAAAFHDEPQTRDSNQGFMGMSLRGQGPLAQMGAVASIGMTSKAMYNLPPKICEMLSAPKFGCNLV